MIAEPVELTSRVDVVRRRFTVDEYLRMAEVGLLAEDDRVELIRGEIIEMSPINVAHALCVNRLNTLLSAKLAGRATISVQNPIYLDQRTLPQPDLAVWKLPSEEFHDRFAGPAEVLLLIEVADSSVTYDRRLKAALYAQAGIVEYWIVNLPERQIEVYREPQAGDYRNVTRHGPDDTLSPLTFPGVTFEVEAILRSPDQR